MKKRMGGYPVSQETLSAWASEYAQPFPISDVLDTQTVIKERFFNLAFARSLQSYRATDIDIMREFLNGNRACDKEFRPMRYKNVGAIQGEIQGKDSHGFPFKRWYLSDADKAKGVLKENHIKPFKASAIEYLLSQRYARIEREP